MSKRDTRYCLECQPFIEEDYLSAGRKYVPVPDPSAGYAESHCMADIKADSVSGRETYIPEKEGVLGHLNAGGRPRKELPFVLILNLSQNGLSIRQIVNELQQQGQPASRMTVSRILSGTR